MINELGKNILRFVIFVLLQVLVMKNLHLGRYIILLPYVMFILLLPFETPKQLVLIFSFITGITIDMFYDTPGMHAAASVILGFSRGLLLPVISPRDGYEVNQKPTIQYMGRAWFITYALTLIFIHHFFFFFIEVFRFSEFFRTLTRVVLSTAGTFAFSYLIQFLFYRKD